MAAVSGIRCMLMRGGTSKGAYFLADDLPADPDERDDLLLRVMGSPDPKQIDGLGGAHPLTSKVAIVSLSTEPGIDVDYLFVQVGVDTASVSLTQTCGNLLAGIGPFAVERGLVPAADDRTSVRIRLVNTGAIADAVFATPGGTVDYDGDTSIDGVPGTAGEINLEIDGGEAPLLPTGHVTDEIDGHAATLIDNGMPVVLLRADEFGVTGDESPEALEADTALTEAVERIRLLAGPLMGLGDVTDTTVPKMFLLSPAKSGGAISTRAFIPAARPHVDRGAHGRIGGGRHPDPRRRRLGRGRHARKRTDDHRAPQRFFPLARARQPQRRGRMDGDIHVTAHGSQDLRRHGLSAPPPLTRTTSSVREDST